MTGRRQRVMTGQFAPAGRFSDLYGRPGSDHKEYI